MLRIFDSQPVCHPRDAFFGRHAAFVRGHGRRRGDRCLHAATGRLSVNTRCGPESLPVSGGRHAHRAGKHPHEMRQVAEPDHAADFRHVFLRVLQQFASRIQTIPTQTKGNRHRGEKNTRTSGNRPVGKELCRYRRRNPVSCVQPEQQKIAASPNRHAAISELRFQRRSGRNRLFRYSYWPDFSRSTSSRVRNRQAPRLRFFFVRPA